MKISEAYKKVMKIERNEKFRELEIDKINVWPLLRRTLWTQLQNTSKKRNHVILESNIFHFLKSFLAKIVNLARSSNKEASYLFFSSPIYLQLLKNGNYFDRIIDPLIYSLNTPKSFEKYYIKFISPAIKLQFSSTVFVSAKTKNLQINSYDLNILNNIACEVDLEPKSLVNAFQKSLRQFNASFKTANEFLIKHRNVKIIYVVCWYNPTMMGIVAAAKKLGIKVIDVQHGKQGKFNAMYSGWRHISHKEKYVMMPDYFWCWGEPSAKQMLKTSKDRKTHIPFVGGYPWIDYWKQNEKFKVKNKSLFQEKNIKKILVTLQPIVWSETKLIPDFILEFMRKNDKSYYFIFRLHPNNKVKMKEIKKYFVGISNSNFCFDNSKLDLYALFDEVDFHITRFSSTCFEASLFQVKTLLYGKDSFELYKDEILDEQFYWTSGCKDDLELFLNDTKSHKTPPKEKLYIQSSLKLAKKLLTLDYN